MNYVLFEIVFFVYEALHSFNVFFVATELSWALEVVFFCSDDDVHSPFFSYKFLHNTIELHIFSVVCAVLLHEDAVCFAKKEKDLGTSVNLSLVISLPCRIVFGKKANQIIDRSVSLIFAIMIVSFDSFERILVLEQVSWIALQNWFVDIFYDLFRGLDSLQIDIDCASSAAFALTRKVHRTQCCDCFPTTSRPVNYQLTLLTEQNLCDFPRAYLQLFWNLNGRYVFEAYSWRVVLETWSTNSVSYMDLDTLLILVINIFMWHGTRR